MLKIDNCQYCAAITHTRYRKLSDLLADIERGEIGCWLCAEDGEGDHTEFDIFNRGEKIWCGHTTKCVDVVGELPLQTVDTVRLKCSQKN